MLFKEICYQRNKGKIIQPVRVLSNDIKSIVHFQPLTVAIVNGRMQQNATGNECYPIDVPETEMIYYGLYCKISTNAAPRGTLCRLFKKSRLRSVYKM